MKVTVRLPGEDWGGEGVVGVTGVGMGVSEGWVGAPWEAAAAGDVTGPVRPAGRTPAPPATTGAGECFWITALLIKFRVWGSRSEPRRRQ